MVKVIAATDLDYRGHHIAAGEAFRVTLRDALILRTRGKISLTIPHKKRAPLPVPVPAGGMFEEAYQHTSRRLVDVLESASGSRSEPLSMPIVDDRPAASDQDEDPAVPRESASARRRRNRLRRSEAPVTNTTDITPDADEEA